MSKLEAGVRELAITRLIPHIRTPLYRNAYALILANAATSGLGIVYWALAARYYSASDVGLNAAMISTMILLSGISQLNLRGALTRFLPVGGRTTVRFVAWAYLASLSMAAIVGIVFILGVKIWAPGIALLRANAGIAIWFILSSMMWCIFVLQDSALTGLRQTITVAVENTLFGIAKIVLLVVLSASSWGFAIFASWTIPTLAVIVPINVMLFRWLIPKHAVATEAQAIPIVPRQIIRFVAGDYLGSLFGEMSDSLLPILVLTWLGAAANAHFYLAWLVSYSLQLIVLSLTTSLTVEGASDQAHLGSYTRRLLLHMARLLIPMVAVILIGAEYILGIFGSGYSAAGATLLRFLALAALPAAINAVYMSRARVQRRTGGIVVVRGVLGVLLLSLSWLLVPRFGIAGIGVAYLISQSTVALVLMLTQLRDTVGPIRPRRWRRAP